MKNTLYILDISSFIFRSFYAIKSLKNSKGQPTNAVYGVATMIQRLLSEHGPEHLAVAFDSKAPSFRKTMYSQYKANRSAPPEDLVPQFDQIETLIRLLKIYSRRIDGVEADDIIAAMTKKWLALNPQNKVVVVTGDKDLMQLVDERVSVLDTLLSKSYGVSDVIQKMGVEPKKINQYLALIGDSSDNIPGVPSIGPKSAVELLNRFGSLKDILEAAQHGKIPGKKGEVLVQNQKEAWLSLDLATLKDDLDIQIEPQSVSFEFEVSSELVAFLKEMDFHSLIKQWSALNKGLTQQPLLSNGVEVDEQKKDLPFYTVNTREQFLEVIEQIKLSKVFAIDLETTSLNPRAAKIVGISLCADPQKAYYVPIEHVDQIGTRLAGQLSGTQVFEILGPYITNPLYKKIGQNLKYDRSVLKENNLLMQGIGGDTMLAAYLINPEGRHNLDTLSQTYLSYGMLSFEEVCGKGKEQKTFDQISIALATRYSAEDAWIAFRLWQKLEPELIKQNLMSIYAQIDLPCLTVLSDMELQGVCIDELYLKELSGKFEGQIGRVAEQIGQYVPADFQGTGKINLNSPKQLAEFLFETLMLPVQSKTKTGYSTDASVLEALVHLHPVPGLLLEYREISKLKSTYVDPLPLLKDPKTGRVHTSFHQNGTATGRLSSSDPNLQNIPIRTQRGRMIRKAFVPQKDCVLLSADYSQIELRLLAHMSGDEDLVASFKRGEDVHARTASQIYEIDIQRVDPEQRSVAKAINFGLMYGKTPFGLSQELGITRAQAKEMIDRYFVRYSGVKKYLDELILMAREKGYSQTLLGRKRWIPEINSKNHMIRTNAERMAMNAPIQGTAADLMKLAMISIQDELDNKKLNSKLWIQVHDEVVLNCPQNEVSIVAELLHTNMEAALELSVPLVVNIEVGHNWDEMEELKR